MKPENLQKTEEQGSSEGSGEDTQVREEKKNVKKKYSYLHKRIQNDEITDEERAQDLFRR